ncbi:MAG: ATP-binding cassette domain-containing protein, partial [Trueperaceae bacterium]|nr:ATP-binding cassette domain-containing protein [Trueperaceae bacterium]
MDALASLRGVTVWADERAVLDRVDWTVRPGDRWGVVGPNGAGKSTLLALLAGARAPAEGRVVRAPGLRIAHLRQDGLALDDREATLADAVREALAPVRRAEAAMAREADRLAAGGGDLRRYGALQEAFEAAGGWRAERRVARAVTAAAGGAPPATRLADLPPDARRRVAWAVAEATRPDLLLLDEPTNGLTVPERDAFAAQVEALPAQTTLVAASHDRAWLARIARQTAQVKGGRLWSVRQPFDVAAPAWGHGRRTAAMGPRPVGRTTVREGRGRGPLLHAADLRVGGDGAAGVRASLRLEDGEVLAILGQGGGGPAALLRALAAEVRPDAGTVTVRPGARVRFASRRDRGLAGASPWAAVTRWVDDGRAASLLAAFGLPHDRWRATPDALSGGERARAGLAALAASEADLVLLETPEDDLDVGGLERLEDLLRAPGTAGVVVTHDVRFADAVARDVATVEDGVLVRWRGGVEGWRRGVRRRDGGADDGRGALEGDAATAPASDVEALEAEAAEVAAALEDPTRLGLRDRARLEARARAVEAERMAAYDAGFAAPAPRYAAVEPPLRLTADRDGDVLAFAPGDLPAAPRMTRAAGAGELDVVHVSLPDPEGGAWLPWARDRVVRACLALTFPVLAPDVVQVRAGRGAPPPPFEAVPGGWWIAT